MIVDTTLTKNFQSGYGLNRPLSKLWRVLNGNEHLSMDLNWNFLKLLWQVSFKHTYSKRIPCFHIIIHANGNWTWVTIDIIISCFLEYYFPFDQCTSNIVGFFWSIFFLFFVITFNFACLINFLCFEFNKM